MDTLNILRIDLLRYLLLSLLLIPIIELCLMVRQPGIAGMACMVVMCLVVDPGDKPAVDSIERLFETAVGVALACGIDILLPYQQTPKPETEHPPAKTSKPEGKPSRESGEGEP